MKKYLKRMVKTPYFAYLPIFLTAVLFIIMPLFHLGKQSLTINDPYDYSSQSIGAANFSKVFADDRFITAVENTAWLLFVVSPIIMLVFFMIAVLISKLSFRLFRNTFIAIIFSQLFISFYSIGITFLVLFGPQTNVLNSLFQTNVDWNNPNDKTYPFLQLVIFYTWTISVMSILLFVVGINRINQNKFFLARLDKLSFFKQIMFIYIPALGRIIYIQIYIFIFQALFFYPTIYENPFALNCQTLSTYIIDNLHIQSSPLSWSLAAAAAVVLILISLGTIALFLICKALIKSYALRSKDVYI